MVVAPEVTKVDEDGHVNNMTVETQMSIVQAISRVLNPNAVAKLAEQNE